MDELPSWVTSFNNLQKSNAYLDETRNTLLPIESYTESTPDDNPYEQTLRGKQGPVFPYEFKSLRKIYRGLKAEFQLIWLSPAGNNLITDFAKEAIKSEELGKDDHPDLLNISYSTPDAAGHAFGPHSVEIEDIYLRLDKNLEDLLNYLDENVGKGEYLIFLSADHAVLPVVSFLNDHKLPSGVAHITKYKEELESHLNEKFGKNFWIQNFDTEQIYLNRKQIEKKNLNLKDVQQEAADFLSELDGINTVLTAYQLKQHEYSKGIKSMVQNGFNPKRSGDLVITFDPGFIQNYNPETKVSDIQGTTHGSGYAYDTHVPIIWYGTGISKGESVRKVSITDIAPSLSMFLNLQLPSGSTGFPLKELFE
jgi:predicted AlkP superfamily pyrophosphatase or phosphodiesterase